MPFIFGFNSISIAETLLPTLGAAAIIYSLLTNYELGLRSCWIWRATAE